MNWGEDVTVVSAPGGGEAQFLYPVQGRDLKSGVPLPAMEFSVWDK